MKKIAFLTLLVLVTVLATLAFTAAASPKAPAQPTATAAPTPAEHPEIHAALEAMRNAKGRLEAAARDFHGHRVKAIEHLNQAIHEAEVCEQEP